MPKGVSATGRISANRKTTGRKTTGRKTTGRKTTGNTNCLENRSVSKPCRQKWKRQQTDL